MRNLALLRVPYATALVVGIFVACANTDAADDPVYPGPQTGASDAAADGSNTNTQGNPPGPPPNCADPAKAPPIESFPSCCTTGRARCVPSAIMGTSASRYTSCSNSGSPGPGSCVPDHRLKGGKATECASLGGAPGTCQSLCVPNVEANKELLPQSTCAPDERCAPCISPIDNMSTGACDTFLPPLNLFGCLNELDASAGDGAPPPRCPHEGPPVVDPATYASCSADDTAHCVPSTSVPPAQQSLLAPCKTTTNTDGYCVPDTVIKTGGRFVLPTCDSIGKGEGRCLHTAIPQVKAQGERLPRDKCEAYEKCTPCYEPVAGKDTGICKLSCDPGPVATRAVYKFPDCCQTMGGGRCVPANFIPPSSQSSVVQRNCASSADRCLPSEFLDPLYVPSACTVPFSALYAGPYAGVCLSDCLEFTAVQGLAIQKGNCGDFKKCVPCKSPAAQGGGNTGAPGCPP